MVVDEHTTNNAIAYISLMTFSINLYPKTTSKTPKTFPTKTQDSISDQDIEDDNENARVHEITRTTSFKQ